MTKIQQKNQPLCQIFLLDLIPIQFAFLHCGIKSEEIHFFPTGINTYVLKSTCFEIFFMIVIDPGLKPTQVLTNRKLPQIITSHTLFSISLKVAKLLPQWFDRKLMEPKPNRKCLVLDNFSFVYLLMR